MEQNSMFDETSNRWVKIFKVFVIVMSVIYALGGFICLILASGTSGGIAGPIALSGLGAILLAFLNYFLGMLITNVVYNIQKTRECVELMAKEKGINTDNVNTNTTNANNDLPTL